MSEPETTGEQQGGRFPKGRSGNPAGRPKGARHKATLAAEMLLDGEAEALTRKAIDQALAGDSTALRLCLERVLAPRRERPIRLALPPLKQAEDAVAAMAAITEAIAQGELTPGEAANLTTWVTGFAKAVEASHLEARIAALEERMIQRGKQSGNAAA
jgi:hypothetical protein